MGAGGAGAQSEAGAKPNIVVIMADDMGFSDIGCYGGEIPTPNIDALAAGGLKFTQFYNCAMCSPSRASLLTGTYPPQAGLGFLEQIAIPDSAGLRGALLNRVATFAELLKDAGYFTAMAGKWHLGISQGVGPWNRGFDRSIASPQGRTYFPDQTTADPRIHEMYIDGKKFPLNSPEVGKGEWYSTDLFVDYSMRYLREAKQQGKPFALYLPFVNAHVPLMAPQEDIARFKGRYKAGWDVLREARFERQKALGIIGPDEKLPPREPNTYDWKKLSPEEQDRFDTIMAVYAAVIERMDKAIGTLVSALKSMGELDNTLILFMSDNGGNAVGGPDGGLKGEMPGGPDSSVQSGMNWATLQDTPYRYFKRFTEEGGISTPLIAHWPRGIDRSLNGGFVREMGHLIDVMPTLLEITGTQYPKSYHGHELVPLQGRSFAPAFHGQPLHRSGPLFFTLQGNRAIRDERWKLVQNWDQPWRLYDMSVDRSETTDLASSRPELVWKMAAQWDTWASNSFVDPWTDKINRMLFKTGHQQNWGSLAVPKIPQAMNSSVTW
jgi:arylsulfatase